MFKFYYLLYNQRFQKMASWILIAIACYWLCISFFSYSLVSKAFTKYKNYKVLQGKPEWSALYRRDFHHWNRNKIIIGCFTLAPVRFMVLFIYLILHFILALCIALRGKLTRNFQKILRLYTHTFTYFMKFFVIDIKEDFDNTMITTPIIISNHVNWFDIFYLTLRTMPISFISKEEVKNYPIVGTLAKGIKCIFLKRSNAQNRRQVIQEIEKRIEDFNNKKQQAFPLIIFPQGTTSNGSGILKFKSGAFDNLSPITAFCLRYQCQNFQMGLDQITQLEHAFLMMTQFPKLTVKKLLMHPKQSETSQKYMERAQKQIAEILGIDNTMAGYRDKVQLQKLRKQTNKSK